ncbi:MAG TPA: hypothetical protein VH083_20195 [Myxococcales bacterium]|jgi:hypothetical protein|nr:hypothetical protein [Myxococcales bacterium]
MVRFISFVLGIALACALAGIFAFHLSIPLVATVGMGVVCLGWLVAVVVLPWNLYFRARHVLSEMATSERRGIAVDVQARAESQALERRMLRISIGLHLISAALLALGSWLLGQHLGYAFAGLFLLSTLFRPAVEYHRYLHDKLFKFEHEVKYPREDVVKLVADVRQLLEANKAHEKTIAVMKEADEALGQAMVKGDRDNQRRLEAVARRFEETIDKLTDNREIISGIKAFLRLVQPSPAP